MKATELQINDLVKIPDTKAPYRRIWAIEYPYNNSVYVDDYGSPDADDNYSICDIEPITLTPKILEKNGWKEAQFWHEYQDGKNTIQSCLPDMRGIINGVEIQHFKCEYVHQYQHLLRLCGLNELADNFKV